jgi:hypothetical protein
VPAIYEKQIAEPVNLGLILPFFNMFSFLVVFLFFLFTFARLIYSLEH